MKKATTIVIILVSLIAIGSFVLSFSALSDFAARNGAPTNLAWIWPLIVDVAVVVCTLVVLVAELNKWSPKFPVGLVVAYGIVTLVGNLWHAPASYAGWFVALLPPATLIAMTELLRVVTKNTLVVGMTTSATTSMSGFDTDDNCQLSERQQHVLELVQAGKEKDEIAKTLSVSVRTIERDIKSLNGALK